MTPKWFLEFKTPRSHSHCLESLEMTSDLVRAFSRYLDRQNASVQVLVDRQGSEGVGSEIVVLMTDFDCSAIANLTGTYCILKNSSFIAAPKIAAHTAEVRVFQSFPRESCSIRVEKLSYRPGGGGGSPRKLRAIDLDTQFFVVIENYRDGEDELAEQYLQARSYVGDVTLRMHCRLHPAAQFYCKFYPRNPVSAELNETDLTQEQCTQFFDHIACLDAIAQSGVLARSHPSSTSSTAPLGSPSS